MNAHQAALRFTAQFPAVFRHTYRRRDPRDPRVHPESIAMLQHLADTGPLTVAETARHLDRSQSATSERIRRLMRRGLLDSVPDRRDRRRHLVWLTEAGLDALRAEREVLSLDLVERALVRLAPEHRQQLIQSMDALLDALRASAREERA